MDKIMGNLLELGKRINSEITLEKLLRLIIDEATNVMDAERSSLFLLDRKKGEIWSKLAKDVDIIEIRSKIGEGITGDVAITGKTENIVDPYNDSRFNKDIDKITGFKTRNILCMPIKNRLCEIIGVIEVLNKKDGYFNEDDEYILSIFSSYSATAIENAKLYEDLNRNFDRVKTLLDVGKAISGEMDIDVLLKLIAEKTSYLLNAERSTLFIIDEDREEMWSRVGEGLTNEIRFRMDLGIAGYVAKTGETLIIDDPYNDPRFNKDIDRKTGFKTKNILCMSMNNRIGKKIGVFQVLNKKSGEFFKEDEDLLQAFSSLAAIALENAQLYEDLKKQFNSMVEVMAASIDARDPLTAGHSHRVTEYAIRIGMELGLSEKGIEILRLAGLLHDYGKIGIEDFILKKDGKLTEEEYKIMKSHVLKTKEILDKIYFQKDFRRIPEIAAYHHERLDGKGYPFGLKNGEIPLEARILAVADFFDALTSKRHYRNPMPIEEVFGVIDGEVGSHFDEEVVNALKRYYANKDG